MRSFTTGLLKGRITRWSVMAAVLVAAGLSLAWMGEPQYRLGGGWIGSGGGMVWTGFNAPLDPAGMTAALRVNPITYPAEVAALLKMFGADAPTEFTGQAQMISRDTANYSFVGYGTKQGNPPQICMIQVYSGQMKYTGPDSFEVVFTCAMYPASADADGDGFPDPGVEPVISFPGGGIAKRVPLP